MHYTDLDLENKLLLRDWAGLPLTKPAQKQEFRTSPNPAAFTNGWSQWGCKLTKSKPEHAGLIPLPVCCSPQRPPQLRGLWSTDGKPLDTGRCASIKVRIRGWLRQERGACMEVNFVPHSCQALLSDLSLLPDSCWQMK